MQKKSISQEKEIEQWLVFEAYLITYYLVVVFDPLEKKWRFIEHLLVRFLALIAVFFGVRDGHCDWRFIISHIKLPWFVCAYQGNLQPLNRDLQILYQWGDWISFLFSFLHAFDWIVDIYLEVF